jgi:hypothetical protein
MDRFKFISDTFINFVMRVKDKELYGELQGQVGKMHTAHGIEHSVQFHKRRLGKQDFCWQGSGHRFWIWQRNNWIVFANNDHGASFEVLTTLSVEDAIESFRDYQRAVGL